MSEAEFRQSRHPQESKSSFKSWLKETISILAIALVISTLLRAFVFQVFWIPSPSMHNTLVEDDRIVVSRISTWLDSPHRGDVVVFGDSLGWLDNSGASASRNPLIKLGEFVGFIPAKGEQTLVKRVIGVGGDHVTCCTDSGKLAVNGVEITEPYIAAGQAPSNTPFDVTVPDGKLWVMGDNRGNSADSRYHTDDGETPFVSVGEVVGQVKFILWPFTRWSGVAHREVFSEVPTAQ